MGYEASDHDSTGIPSTLESRHAISRSGVRSPDSHRLTAEDDAPIASHKRVWFQPFSSMHSRRRSAPLGSFAMTLNIAECQILSTVNHQCCTSAGVAAWQHEWVSFGARLKEARKARGLTGLDLQERTGISNTSISRWETGKRAPKGEFVTKLARELGVTERWLMTGDGAREPVKLAAEPPVGPAGLEQVLYTHDWPEDVPIEVADEVIAMLRDESRSSDSQRRPASAWRLRLKQLLRERLGGRPRRAVGSGRL